MANYQLLKADIDEKVYQNGAQEITGTNLNSVLNEMVTTLGVEYQFAGVATIDTNPGTPDAKVFYIANGKGTYTNFGGIEVTENEVVVLYWDTAWHKEATGIASNAKLNELGQNLVKVGRNLDQYNNEEFYLKINDEDTLLNSGYSFLGEATTTTVPITPKGRVCYIAKERGVYTHFGGVTVKTLSFLVFKGNSWLVKPVNVDFSYSTRGDCVTAADVAEKVITVSNFYIAENCHLIIYFANPNTASGPKLNINGTGAKDFYFNGQIGSNTNSWEGGSYVEIIYSSALDKYLCYQMPIIEQGLGLNDMRLVSQKALTEIVTPYSNKAYNLINGKLILNNGTITNQPICSYTKPIYLKKGQRIRGKVRSNQRLLYQTDNTGSYYSGIVFSNGSDTVQSFEYIAPEDMYVAISGVTETIEIIPDTDGFLLSSIPLPLEFIYGYIIIYNGSKSTNSICYYTKPILLKKGETIIVCTKTNQGILYQTDADGSYYNQILAHGTSEERVWWGEWTATDDMYVAVSGVIGSIKAYCGIRTYYANIQNYYPNTFGMEEDKVLSQKTMTSILKGVDSQDPLLFHDFDLPVQTAENGTDPKGIINLKTATVQDVYDMYDALIARSNGYITKEVLGKDESGQYEVWKLTATDKFMNVTDRTSGTDTTVSQPIYKRRVVIDANVHGAPADPKDATMTVYNLLRFIIDNPTNEVAKWLRETYQFIIIPILNPWGFDHQEDKNGVNHSGYGNYNGVNCNDNYPTDDFIPNYTHASIYNCSIGTSPLSEKETQYINNILTSYPDIFAWLDIHSYGPNNGRHASYCVQDDYLHPYNPKRMLEVIEHARRKVTPVHDDYWFSALNERGWSPRYGSCHLGIWCPHMEMANRVGANNEEYSSAALTSDLYYLVGQLMFK